MFGGSKPKAESKKDEEKKEEITKQVLSQKSDHKD